MKEDLNKPLYADYKKQAWDCLKDDRPVHSGEKLFEFADRVLILFVYFELIAGFILIYLYLPKPDVFGIFLSLALYALGILCLMAYIRLFVYRYARFRVLWEDWQTHSDAACEICDERGDFLKTKENSRAAIMSRFAFAALSLLIAAAAVTFYFVTWGMAEERVRNSPWLQEFVRIAEKQGDVSLYVDSDGVEAWSADGKTTKEIAYKDEEELEVIFRKLQWNYVDELNWYNGGLHVYMKSRFEYKSLDVPLGQQ